MTEFGAFRHELNNLGNIYGQDEESTIETYDDRIPRARWHYDTRKFLEVHGIAWTVFEHQGQMGMLGGRLEAGFNTSNLNLPNHIGQTIIPAFSLPYSGRSEAPWLSTYLQQGMFGTRP